MNALGIAPIFALLTATGVDAAAQSAERAPAARAPDERAPVEPSAAPRREIELSLFGAFGAGGNVDDSTINRYGPGIGLRAGLTLKAPRLYFGASMVRFFGAEDDSGKYYTATVDAHFGYDFRFLDERLLIRPELALGVAQAVTIQSDNAGYPLAPHVAPGLLVGLRMKPLLAFAEVRRDFVPGDWANSVSVLFGAGAVF